MAGYYILPQDDSILLAGDGLVDRADLMVFQKSLDIDIETLDYTYRPLQDRNGVSQVYRMKNLELDDLPNLPLVSSGCLISPQYITILTSWYKAVRKKNV